MSRPEPARVQRACRVDRGAARDELRDVDRELARCALLTPAQKLKPEASDGLVGWWDANTRSRKGAPP
jgi:hypothetical protein